MAFIFGQGTEKDPNALPLYTRSRTWIENELRDEGVPEILKAAKEIHKESHPDAIFRSISFQYNCMGMVFATRRTHIAVSTLPLIVEGDGLVQVLDVAAAHVGDIVVYARDEAGKLVDSHVGIVFRKDIVGPDSDKSGIWILSKWGNDGEYLHLMEDVPTLHGKPIRFYTDRKNA